ncbi:MAG TPA: hypothetical protein PLQ15_13690 [Syntrophales bacterium]|nr:hypothetical protein [Syntrophales bacterium]
MNRRFIIPVILLAIGLFCWACGQSPEKAPVKAVTDAQKPAAPKKTIRVKHLTGEILAVDAKAKTISIRVRGEDIRLLFDDQTVVKVDLDRVRPQEIPAGSRAAVKYVESRGQRLAKGVFISTETAEKKDSPPQSSFRITA